MSTQEKIADALAKVHAAKRTLALARQVACNAYDSTMVHDVVQSLARQLAAAELEAARLIGATGSTLGDGYVSVARNDRRGSVRPSFHYRHALAMECAQ